MALREPDSVVPIVVDLGTTRKKKVKQLKRGEGELMDEVNAILGEVGEALSEKIGDRQILPVVLIYRRKRGKRKRSGNFSFPSFFGR